MWILLAVVALVVVAALVGIGVFAVKFITADRETQAEVTLTFEVTGSGPIESVTYSGPGYTANTTEEDVALPWTKTVTVYRGVGYSLMAKASAKGGTLECTVSLDGEVIQTQSMAAHERAVTCTGVLERH